MRRWRSRLALLGVRGRLVLLLAARRALLLLGLGVRGRLRRGLRGGAGLSRPRALGRRRLLRRLGDLGLGGVARLGLGRRQRLGRGPFLGLAAGLLLGLATGALLRLATRLLLCLQPGLLFLVTEASAALGDDVADRARDQRAGADRVVVARHDVVDAVGVAV